VFFVNSGIKPSPRREFSMDVEAAVDKLDRERVAAGAGTEVEKMIKV
jgi:hypothetical protein